MVMIPKKGQKAEGASNEAAAPAASPAPAAALAAAAAPAATTQAPAAAPAEAAAQPAAAPAAQTAVATQGSRAVAVAGRPVNVVQEDFKDKMPLEWNTLHRIQANQGNFLDMEDNKKALGNTITGNLLTYQDDWQISPGTDDPNDTQHVRYSNDGKFTTQGEDCMEYLTALKEAGYTDAKMSTRCTLAFEILACPQRPDFEGKLVQISLPTTSKQMFDRFQLQSSLDVARGKKTREQCGVLKMTANVVSKGNYSWTQVLFDYGA